MRSLMFKMKSAPTVEILISVTRSLFMGRPKYLILKLLKELGSVHEKFDV